MAEHSMFEPFYAPIKSSLAIDGVTARSIDISEDRRDVEIRLLKEEKKKLIDENYLLKKDVSVMKKMLEEKMPERYIVNENATILFWKDGEKTIVKKCEDDDFNPRLGFLTAFFQRHCNMTKNKANKYLANIEENVERKTPRYVKVVDCGKTYSLYSKFVQKHFPEYFKQFVRGDSPDRRKKYLLIGEKEHDEFDARLYLIQDEQKQQVFLIEKVGVKEVKNGK